MTNTRLAIWAYNTGSRSAHELSAALEAPIIRHTGSKFRGWGLKSFKIINWGSTECKSYDNVLNPASLVQRASNKLTAFTSWGGTHCPRIPLWTTSRKEASEWFSQKKFKECLVVCRTILSGHSGNGIVISSSPRELVDAPLYTLYIPKDAEYRVHMADWRVEPIFVQRKVRDPDREPTTWKVRSHANGFIYQHNHKSDIPLDVLAQAASAFKASSLDFGAVDVIYNERERKAYVLEINTAPGLEGETILRYANAFKDL